MSAPAKRARAAAQRRHFTDRNVLTLPAKGKQYLVWDAASQRASKEDCARGLTILVSPTGTKSYRCVYTYPGVPKPHWLHLGRVGEMTLAAARNKCREVRRIASEGNDPTADAPAHSDSFKAAVESYIKHEQIGSRERLSASETQAVMLNNCADWHSRPVATIRAKEIGDLLKAVRDGDAEHGVKPRRYLANRLHSHLKDFFAWCTQSENALLKQSPMADMKQPWKGAKPRERDWFKKQAADRAIKSLWQAASEIGGSGERYVKVLLLIGKRKTALANMRWEQIEADWFWDAPPSRAKNKRLHGVPLPTLAQRVLHPRQAQGKVFDDLPDLDRLEDELRRRSSLKDFFWHGARHILETKMAELHDEEERTVILPHIRDLLLDHASKRGTGAHYDHHDYKKEMRAALEAWADYVEQLVQPEGAALLR